MYDILNLKNIFYKLDNYVLLQGFYNLHKKIPLLKNSDDIDLLLDNKDDITKIYGNDIISINNEKVKFNIRYIGDNYYDKKWQKNMIKSRIKHHFFYIMDETNNYYATLYHSLIHKGNIHNKYLDLYETYEKKNNLKSDILSRYYQLLYFMIKNNYEFVRANDKGVSYFKNKYKLNIFIIRKKGLQPDIIENILDKIEKEYQIIDKILINITNLKKFYKKFYANYTKYEKEILISNDNQCLVIVTNRPKGKNPNNLKKKIRKEYIDIFPPNGNIIHSSDTARKGEIQLKLLLSEGLDNFQIRCCTGVNLKYLYKNY